VDQQILTLQRRLSSVELVDTKRGEFLMINSLLPTFDLGFFLGMIFVWNIFAALFIISILQERKREREEYDFY